MREDVPSDTAVLIARSILLSSRDPELDCLVAAGEEELLSRMLGARASGGWFGFVRRRAWCRRLLFGVEKLLLGGIFAHYLARKRWIEREARRALAEGLQRVIVLGAGLDTLAWRLHGEFPAAAFFEIDHPATQAAKSGVEGAGPNLRFLPADLSRTLPAEALEPAEPALVIAEGLTMYFDGDRVAALLGSAAELAGKGGRVLFTFMEKAADGSIGFRGENAAVGWWLRLRKEPFRWGCRREDLEGFLAGCGLEMIALADHRELAAAVLRPRGLDKVGLARGELLCLCSTRI